MSTYHLHRFSLHYTSLCKSNGTDLQMAGSANVHGRKNYITYLGTSHVTRLLHQFSWSYDPAMHTGTRENLMQYGYANKNLYKYSWSRSRWSRLTQTYIISPDYYTLTTVPPSPQYRFSRLPRHTCQQSDWTPPRLLSCQHPKPYTSVASTFFLSLDLFFLTFWGIFFCLSCFFSYWSVTFKKKLFPHIAKQLAQRKSPAKLSHSIC